MHLTRGMQFLGGIVVAAGATFNASAAPAGPIRFDKPTNYFINDYVTQLAVGDFTRDGNLDLAVVYGEGATLALLPGSPTGVFATPQLTSVIYYLPRVITAADFSGDGRLDIVAAGSHNINGGNPYGLQTFLDQEDGTLNALPYSIRNYVIPYLGAGTFTGASSPDLVMSVTQPSGDGIVVAPGGGGGSFGTGLFTALPGATPGNFVARDFNADGKTDLIVTDQGNRRLLLLLGNGDGTFQAPIDIALPQGGAAVATADLDGDGKPDLVVASSSSIISLLGNGDGTFKSPMTFPAGKLLRSLVAVDLNCDGKVDVATANYNGPGVSVLKGNGDGTFAAPAYLKAGTEPVYIVAGDFNRDGRPDLAVANFASENVSVFLNTSRAPATGCRLP